MYRETNQSADSKTLDLVLIAALLLLIIFATALRDLVVSLPYGNILRYAAFAAVLLALYFLYARRIVSYRYTLYVEDGADRPKGTFLVDRMIADKGREALALKAENLMALIEPGTALGIAFKGGEEPPRLHVKKLTVKSAKTAYRLIYQKDGKFYALNFHPSKKFARLLSEAVAEAAKMRAETKK
ncbi:MAG TPA: hypothetical protein VN512_00575 [Clostridia bacterium]|nr:hypothetical protein [Clostridia bacterium]